MPASTRGLPTRVLALLILLVVAGAVVAGAAAARHHHDGPGVYDERCPLEALGAFDRTGGLVSVPAPAPVEVAAALVLLPAVVGPRLAPAADARLRAPPSR
jgi:hypothetical protein